MLKQKSYGCKKSNNRGGINMKSVKSVFPMLLVLMVLVLMVLLLPASVVLAQTDNATEPVPVLISEEPPEAKFREGPVVKLRPVTDEITAAGDGLVELFFSNPSLNDVTLEADVYVEVPSGIHVFGEGFGTGAAAGTVYGHFTVPPGSARTIYLNIQADKTAVGETHFAHFTGLYWPQGNKDAYNPISLTHPFTVVEPTDPSRIGEDDGIHGIPGGIAPYWWIILAAVVLGGIAIIFAVRRKTDISIEK